MLWGLADWAGGDQGRLFEVAGESLALTGITVETAKTIFPRQRPDKSCRDSFPSGHTALSFAGATLMARALDARQILVAADQGRNHLASE